MDGAQQLGDGLLSKEAPVAALPPFWRWAWTLTFWWAVFALGVALAMLGPTLDELAQQLGLETGAAGSLFTFRAFGYLLGAVGCSDLIKRFPSAAVAFAVPNLVTFVGALVIPTITSYPLAAFLLSFQGIAMGMLDTGGNIVMLNLWRGSGYQEGFVHAFHFLFGVGATVAPVVVGLLLHRDIEAMYSWYVVAGIFLATAASFLALIRSPQPFTGKEENDSSTLTAKSIVTLTGAFLFVYVGMEVVYGGYIDLFAVRWIGVSKVQGAALTSVYWAGLSLSRGVASLVTSFVHHARYIGWHLLLSIVSMGALCVITRHGPGAAASLSSGSYESVMGLTFLFGFALGPLFPGALLVAEELNGGVPLPERDTGRLVGAAACGEMCLPLIVGALFAWNPWNFCIDQLVFCAVTAALFLANSGGLLVARKH